MKDDLNTIKILYIDDSPEAELSKSLDNYSFKSCNVLHEDDITFDPRKGYEALIEDQRVRDANIILIDSKLFENRRITSGKFSGEEFKLILRKHFPYIEVIVVTQNDIEEGYLKFPKFNRHNHNGTAFQYYSNELPNVLNPAVRNVLEYRKIAENLKSNSSMEKVLVEKITNSLEGIGTYDELTKTDIDNFVAVFIEIQEMLNDK